MGLRFFCVTRAAASTDDPDIRCHHRHDAKYNQELHAVSSFRPRAMKMDAPLSVPHCYGRRRDRDGPSDRNCSRRLLQPHPVSLWQARRSATATLSVPFRRSKTESFSCICSFFCCTRTLGGSFVEHSTRIGFCFAKFARRSPSLWRRKSLSERHPRSKYFTSPAF